MITLEKIPLILSLLVGGILLCLIQSFRWWMRAYVLKCLIQDRDGIIAIWQKANRSIPQMAFADPLTLRGLRLSANNHSTHWLKDAAILALMILVINAI